MKFNKFLLVFIMIFLMAVPIVFGEDNSTVYLCADGLNETTSISLESSDDETIGENSFGDTSNNSLESTGESKLGDGDGEYINASVTYEYLNAFRSEEGVWFWQSDDLTVQYFNTNDYNRLSYLAWDPDFEQAAMIRAKELSQYFSHNRPDGSEWDTVYPKSDNLMPIAECINGVPIKEAVDFESTGIVAVERWKEISFIYTAQPHRRGMLLPNFNCVGIAGFRLDEGKNVYWVLSLGWKRIYNTSNNLPADLPPASDGEGSFSDLNDLITNNVGNIVRLEKDYVYTSADLALSMGIDISRPLTIDGQGHIIDARHSARIFRIMDGNVTFTNIKFLNANRDCNEWNMSSTRDFFNSSYAGGAIYSIASALTLMNCSFANSNAYFGAALYSKNGNVTFIQCNFTGNLAVAGGAVCMDGSNFSVIHSNFINNTAIQDGGAIYSTSGCFSLKNSHFIHNTVKYYSKDDYRNGGAICSRNALISIENCDFADNAGYAGGTIYSCSDIIDIADSNFTNGSVSAGVGGACGGAICSYQSNISFVNCRFNNNRAIRVIGSVSLNGGALYSYYSNIRADNCIFTDNFAESKGSAIYSDCSDLSVVNCLFNENTANASGTVYFQQGNMSAINCNFTDNSADYGGAVYAYKADVDLVYCSFIANEASHFFSNGGAVYIHSGDNISVSNCSFIGNKVSSNYVSHGGAAHVIGNMISIANCSFIDNAINSTYYYVGGGAMYLAGNASVVNCSFEGNAANSVYCAEGGAIYLDGGYFFTEKCTFNNNCAYEGGAIFLNKGNLSVVKSGFNANSASYSSAISSGLEMLKINITDCEFINNDGIVSLDGHIIIYNSVVIENDEDVTGIYLEKFGCSQNGSAASNDTNLIVTYFNLAQYYGFVNEEVSLSVQLLSEYGYVFGENVEYVIEGKVYQSRSRPQLGLALLTHIFDNVGTYYFTVKFTGGNGYAPCNATGEIIIKNPIEAKITQDINFKNATISVDFGKNVVGEVIFGINDGNKSNFPNTYFWNDYHIKIRNGKSVLRLNDLKNRNYIFNVRLNCSDYDFREEMGSEFTVNVVKTGLLAGDVEAFVGDEIRYQIKLLKDGNAFANQTVTLCLNNNLHTGTTDDRGLVDFTFNLTSGSYPVTINYKGFGNTYLPAQISRNILVKLTCLTSQDTEFLPNSVYGVTMLDNNGNLLRDKMISVAIDNVEHALKTDSSGRLLITLNLGEGTHSIKIINPVTGEVIKRNVVVKAKKNSQQQSKAKKVNPKKIIRTKDISVKRGKKIRFKASLFNEKGKIMKGKKLIFKFKGKKYKVRTNRKGIAILKLKIKFKKGKYIIKTTYGKYTVKNTIRIK